MKRGGPLKRNTPLRRTAWGRYNEIARKAWTRKPGTPAVPKATKTALMLRAENLCEIGLDGCNRWAVDPSHRKGSKQGGRRGRAKEVHDRLSNLLAACRSCHDEITSAVEPRLTFYRETGLLLEEHQDPAEEMVNSPALTALYGGPVYLTDTGHFWPADLSPINPQGVWPEDEETAHA